MEAAIHPAAAGRLRPRTGRLRWTRYRPRRSRCGWHGASGGHAHRTWRSQGHPRRPPRNLRHRRWVDYYDSRIGRSRPAGCEDRDRRGPRLQGEGSGWPGSMQGRKRTRTRRAGLLDVMCYTQKTSTPGWIAEDDVRVWAGYTPDEWTAHRAAFLRLFRVRPDGVWVLTVVRSQYRQQLVRLKRARAASLVASRKRWKGKGVTAAAVVKGHRQACEPHTLGNASVLSSQGNQTTVPESGVRTGTGPPATSVADAAAVAGLVAGVVARLGSAGSGP